MSGLFGGGSSPALAPPPAPVPVPTIDDAKKRQQAQDAANRRRGRAATIFTGNEGAGAPVQAKTLFGS